MPTGSLCHGGFSQRLAAGFIDGMQLKVAIGGRFDMHTTPGISEPEPEPEKAPAVRLDSNSDEEIETIIMVSQLLKVCMGRRPQDQPTPEKILSALQAHPGAELRQTESGFTALHFLCENPYASCDTIKVLLRANPAAAAVASMYSECPLHLLCRNSSEALFVDGALAVELLVDAHPEAATLTDTYGNAPLHWIVRNQQASVEAIEILLNAHPQSAARPDRVRKPPPCHAPTSAALSARCVRRQRLCEH